MTDRIKPGQIDEVKRLMRYGQQQLRGCKLINYHETRNVTLPALPSVSPFPVSLSADLGLDWPAFAPTLLSCFSPHHNEI